MNFYNHFFSGIMLVLFHLLLCVQVHAQHEITGKVLDVEGNPIEAGNVLVLTVTDSSLITGNLFLEGSFSIEGISPSRFLLKITALGYQEHLMEVNMRDKEQQDVGNITLLSNATLEEVVVVAVVSGVEANQSNGKVTFKIQDQGAYAAASAGEILDKLPGVYKDHNGQLSTFGRGAVTVLINGRKPAPGMLESLRSDQIASIEVITNPDARYQAEGKGGIINVITKSQQLEGIYYSIYSSITKAVYQRGYLKAQISYKKNKTHLFGHLGNNPQKILFQDYYLREGVGSDSNTYSFDNTLEKTRTFLKAFNYQAGIEWTPTDKKLFSLRYSGYLFGDKEETVNTNLLSATSGDQLELNTFTKSRYNYGANTLDMEYRYQADSSGHRTFSFFGSATYFKLNREDDIFTDSRTAGGNRFENMLLNTSSDNLWLYALQTDYHMPLGDRGGQLALGARYDLADKQSALSLVEQVQGDILQQDQYAYQEHDVAGYVQWNLKKNSWEAGLGLRSEYSILSGMSEQTAFTLDTSFLVFFPSASFSYRVSQELTANISYAKRITRPVFQQLNPFVVYIDSFSYFKGNPFLLPEINHSYEFSLTYRQVASLKIGYVQAVNPMFLTVQQEGLFTTAITNNLEESQKFYISLALPYQTKIWTTYNAFGWSKDQYTFLTEEDQPSTVLQKPLWYAYLYNEFRLPANFSTALIFQYVSDGVNGVFEFREKWTMRWSLQKKFNDGRWTLSFIVNDPFRTDLLRSHTSLGDIDIYYNTYTDKQYYRFSAKYVFGTPLKAKASKSNETKGRIQVD